MFDPQIQACAQRQAEIEDAKVAFFMCGGKVQECGLSETAPHRPSVWNSAITQRKDARRSFTEKERQLAGLIRDLACITTNHGEVRRTAMEIRKKLLGMGERVTGPQIEQSAAKFQIILAFAGAKC